MKAKITAHPRYSTLVEAYIECQKVGATPRVVARLAAVAGELGTQQRAARCFHDAPSVDPELSQFMELKRPLQEAMDFLRRRKRSSMTSPPVLHGSSLENFEDSWSSEEDGDACGRGRELAEDRQQAMGRDLKNDLLKRYGEHLCSLKQELSKKKNKKGKLPKEARQKLLIWWELHYSWPYPSVSVHLVRVGIGEGGLRESTGLTQNQISNWFINQRKRHWKPSEDARPGVGEGRAAAVYMAGQSFPGDGRYRAGP
ncbi:unnamed protein product [Spirodela intermedia]|uniref:Uncharacterized protein n=1 Tax=Spirodela intermedia TaxID=51605 RepID=A0A7I8I7Q9_SPIIN|nr:unnamed protein product [Spirodela intermedia]CAA6653494.1 unnamed protein product [Spirodela intermedia]